MWARIHLTPLLQAEEDRDQVRRYWADQAREKELLGENRQVYNSDKYVHITPGHRHFPSSLTMGALGDSPLGDCLLTSMSS